MDRRRNMLIGIVVGIVVVAASIYATGFTKQLLRPFRSNVAEYKSSESSAAPELATGDWINSEPLRLKGLRGRVVLIEFWTFGCYNCRNTLPFIKGWDARYRAKGLTVIGVHSPEFDEERKIEHLTYTFTRRPDGTTDIDVVVVREGKNLKGRLLGFMLGTVGKRVLERAFENSVKAIEARNGAAREVGAS